VKLVRQISNNVGVYLFADSAVVVITDTGMRSPKRALDIRPQTHEVVDNVAAPVGGFKPGKQTYIDGVWSDA
jgi:hypothetical protein